MKNEKMLLYKKIMVTVVSSGMLLLPNWGYALAAVQWRLPATAAIWL